MNSSPEMMANLPETMDNFPEKMDGKFTWDDGQFTFDEEQFTWDDDDDRLVACASSPSRFQRLSHMNRHYWQQHPAVQPDSTDFVRERTQSSLQMSLQETVRTAGHMEPDRTKEQFSPDDTVFECYIISEFVIMRLLINVLWTTWLFTEILSRSLPQCLIYKEALTNIVYQPIKINQWSCQYPPRETSQRGQTIWNVLSWKQSDISNRAENLQIEAESQNLGPATEKTVHQEQLQS